MVLCAHTCFMRVGKAGEKLLGSRACTFLVLKDTTRHCKVDAPIHVPAAFESSVVLVALLVPATVRLVHFCPFDG